MSIDDKTISQKELIMWLKRDFSYMWFKLVWDLTNKDINGETEDPRAGLPDTNDSLWDINLPEIMHCLRQLEKVIDCSVPEVSVMEKVELYNEGIEKGKESLTLEHCPDWNKSWGACELSKDRETVNVRKTELEAMCKECKKPNERPCGECKHLSSKKHCYSEGCKALECLKQVPSYGYDHYHRPDNKAFYCCFFEERMANDIIQEGLNAIKDSNIRDVVIKELDKIAEKKPITNGFLCKMHDKFLYIVEKPNSAYMNEYCNRCEHICKFSVKKQESFKNKYMCPDCNIELHSATTTSTADSPNQAYFSCPNCLMSFPEVYLKLGENANPEWIAGEEQCSECEKAADYCSNCAVLIKDVQELFRNWYPNIWVEVLEKNEIEPFQLQKLISLFKKMTELQKKWEVK